MATSLNYAPLRGDVAFKVLRAVDQINKSGIEVDKRPKSHHLNRFAWVLIVLGFIFAVAMFVWISQR